MSFGAWLRRRGAGLASLAAAIALGVFVSRLDWRATAVYLQQLGAAAPLVLLPYAFVLAADTRGWQNSFEHPRQLAFLTLWRLRIVTEALANSLPAGVAVAETVKALLLTRKLGLTLTDAAANVVVSKFALALAQALFLLPGLWLGAAVLTRTGTPAAYVAVVLGLLALIGVGVKLAASGTSSRLLAGLMRISPAALRRRLAGLAEPIAGLDRSLAVIRRLPPRQIARSVGWFLLGWSALSLENWLILRLLSPHTSFAMAASMEAVVSVVRLLFFFLPAGLGAQDMSYYALLNLWGVPDAPAIASAFMLIKRAKEACWIALGYALLWRQPNGVNARAQAPG